MPIDKSCRTFFTVAAVLSEGCPVALVSDFIVCSL
jgi:hypothetical protein